MSAAIQVRPASAQDLEPLLQIRRQAIATVPMPESARRRWAGHDPRRRYRELIRDGCLLAAVGDGKALGMAGLELDNREIIATFVHPGARRLGLGRRLIRALEATARAFGITEMRLDAAPGAEAFYQSLGYRKAGCGEPSSPVAGAGCAWMARDMSAELNDYQRQVLAHCKTFGIDPLYGVHHRLRIVPPAAALTDIGQDIHGRQRQATPHTAAAWAAMRDAAAADGIVLQLVSAHRDLDYQCGIVRHKLDRDQPIDTILAVSAAPGFSEHHSGRALDLTTPGSKALETEFENTPAFAWLAGHAGEFGFRLSYPRHNRHGIAYEPWHWCWVGDAE